jgi:hypothetical protein
MKIIDTVEQLLKEWFEFRAGMPTASCFDKILTPTGKVSTQRKQYLYQLAGERITRTKTETYTSWAMQEGIEKEEKARLMFEMIHDVEVKQVAFCIDNTESYGCSPDGLLELSGIEIKSPLLSTHVEYLLAGKIPTKYIPQVQGSMLVTGYNHWFFMSYFPNITPLIIDVPRDDKYCASLKIELQTFCEELDDLEKKLRALN